MTIANSVVAAWPENDCLDTEEMMKVKCPKCGCGSSRRDGFDRHGKQRLCCRVCGTSYLAQRDHTRPLVREIAAGLLSEGVPVPVLARALQRHCSKRWLYNLRAKLAKTNGSK